MFGKTIMAERGELKLDPKILVGVREGRIVLRRTLIPPSLINLTQEQIDDERIQFSDRARFRRGMLEELRPNVTITIETPQSAKSLTESLAERRVIENNRTDESTQPRRTNALTGGVFARIARESSRTQRPRRNK